MNPVLATLSAAAVLVAAVAFPSTARADEDAAPQAASRADNDFLFPGDGKVSLTGSTGLPYAALGEVSVGVGDRLAVGGLVAGGPFLGGFATGVYPRLDVAHFGPMRLVLEAPVVWYPDLQNTDNWIVARPDVRIEGRTGHVRIHASAGAMYAKMIGATPVQGPVAAYGGNGLPSGVQQGTVWNTAGAGVALALSPRTSVFAEGFLILHGVELAGPEWFALPCGSFLGVSTTL
ncbi:MAG TPA: hypothetical protein VGG39_05800 [Polyangiaceae bacterium]|jgi:hypothetical protein